MHDLRPVTLEGTYVRLEPLSHDHAPDLAKVAFDPKLWRYPVAQILSDDELAGYIDAADAERRAGMSIPFATIERTSGRAIGCTRYCDIDAEHARVEIGWTWLGRDYQRKAFNTEAKLLMLEHAFERMGAIRVGFRADVGNAPSRRALQRIGAREEGVLRSFSRLADGRVIDWAYYSILPAEWPAVRDELRKKLAAHERR